MKIVIVLKYFYSPSVPIGGAERQAAELAKKLIDKGIEITIIAGQWTFGEPKKAVVAGITVHRLFTFWEMFSITGLRKFGHYTYLVTLFTYLLIHRNQYDLIHCFSAVSSLLAAVPASKLVGKKTLARPMASGNKWGDIGRIKNGSGFLERLWLLDRVKEVNCVVALNQEVAKELQEIGIAADRIIPLPNGVETKGVQRKNNYKIAPPAKVTFVGRLHPQKGIDILLLALKRLLENKPQLQWRLQLVGKGPRQSDLEAKVKKLGLNHRTEFLGQVQDVSPILSESDIFVLPSRAEGMSNALLEAMNYGLPCIVTNISANTAIIEHNKNGLIVNRDDEESLEKAISYLIENEEIREKLGREAVRTISEKYSIDRVAEQYIKLYRNLSQDGIVSIVDQ